MWKLGKTTTSCLVLASLVLSACGKEKTPNLFLDLHIKMSLWGQIEPARKAYPNLHPGEARDTYKNDLMRQYFDDEQDSNKRHVMAAIIYLGYSQKHLRARAAYCDSLGVDISPYKSYLEYNHKSEDITVDRILAQNQISRETVWERNKINLVPNAKNNLWAIGGMKDPAVICSDIKNNPAKYTYSLNFGQVTPIAAQQLKQAQASFDAADGKTP